MISKFVLKKKENSDFFLLAYSYIFFPLFDQILSYSIINPIVLKKNKKLRDRGLEKIYIFFHFRQRLKKTDLYEQNQLINDVYVDECRVLKI